MMPFHRLRSKSGRSPKLLKSSVTNSYQQIERQFFAALLSFACNALKDRSGRISAAADFQIARYCVWIVD